MIRVYTYYKLIILSALVFLSSCQPVDTNALLSAGADAYEAISLTDEQVQSLARQAATVSDQNNVVANSNNRYQRRLDQLIRKHTNEDGLNLNYKVYLSQDINAFAMADGTIRIYSGLMDKMTDQELLFVIGHEIGHVKLGHTRKAAQVAYGARAARTAVGALSGQIGEIARSEMAALAEKIVNAQFSQKEEKDADEYGLEFMQRNQYNPQASITALRKLGTQGGGFLDSHPSPQDRAARLEKEISD